MTLPPSGKTLDLATRISQWTQEVARDIKQEHTSEPGLGQRRSTRLQSLASKSRLSLAEISANPRLRKRKTPQDDPSIATSSVGAKRIRTMVAKEMEVVEVPKRGRGRPRKIPDSSQQPVTLPHHAHRSSSRPDLTPALTFSIAASATPRGKSQSPRKRNNKYLDQPRTIATVDIPFLQSCRPGIRLLDYQAVRASAKTRPIPAQVQHLHKKLQDIPHGLIPSELKVGSSSPCGPQF